jgi:hypothetical protein
MHAAIAKRLAQMIARGLDPGADYGVEWKTTNEVVHPFEFGTFRVYLKVPNVEEAWFDADAESAWRFRSDPA